MRQGIPRQLRPTRQPQLLLDVRPVRLDRADAEVELLADLAVGVSERHQLEDVGLPRGEDGALVGAG
jgi:hypothetical protein